MMPRAGASGVRRAVLLLAGLLAGPLAGCAGDGGGAQGSDAAGSTGASKAADATTLPAGSAAALVDGHRAMLAGLPSLTASGALVMSWQDKDGKHREQVQVRFYLERPCVAVRILSPAGPLAWLGTDGRRWWWFMLAERPTRLITGAVGTDGRAVRGPPISAPELLLLMGLEPLGAPAEPAVAEATGGRRRVEIPAGRFPRPMRAWFDAGGLLVRLEVLGPDGAVMAASDLARPRAVEIQGVAPAQWPRIPMEMQVSLPAAAGRDEAAWALTFELPTGLDERTRGKVFDLEGLRATLTPGVVDEVR